MRAFVVRRRGGTKKAGKIALIARRITRAASVGAAWRKMMRRPSPKIAHGKGRPRVEGSRPMCDAAEFARLGRAGREVREVLARQRLTLAEERQVLAALLAHKTIAGHRQDEWARVGKDTLEMVYCFILGETAHQTAAFAAAPIGGNA
jgi:hypothetical protein